MSGRLIFIIVVFFEIWTPNTSRYLVSGRALKQQKCTTANRHERKHRRGERATDVRRAVVERTPIHTHIYRYEARGVRLGGCKAVRLGGGEAGRL